MEKEMLKTWKNKAINLTPNVIHFILNALFLSHTGEDCSTNTTMLFLKPMAKLE